MIVDVSKEPSVLQYNNSRLNEKVRPRITTGTEQAIKSDHRDELCRHIMSVCHMGTDKASIFLAIGAVLIILGFPSFAFGTVCIISCGIELPGFVIAHLAFGIVTIAASVWCLVQFFKRNKEAKIRKEARLKICQAAVERVKKGEIKCYKYNISQIRRYTYPSGEGADEVEYYIDLGEFSVYQGRKLAEWERCTCAYATVVEIEGEDFFFLYHWE